jgi:hypothetical protein
MKRRDVLATAAVFVSAGCLGGGNTDDSGEGGGGSATPNTPTTRTETDADGTADPRTRTTTETTNSATEIPVETPASPVQIPDVPTDDRNHTALPEGNARVAFENGGSRLVITGTIVAQNGCQTAVLDSVDETASGLIVTVATERDAPANALCTQALVGVEYRFVVHPTRPPDSVRIVHRGVTGSQRITTANASE